MTRCCGFPICLLLLFPVLVAGQSPSPAPVSAANYNVNVPSTQAWTDTQVDLHPGDVVRFTATAGKGNCNPEGIQGAQQKEGLQLSAATPGTLIGHVGAQAPFVVGSSKELKVEQQGRLFLGINGGSGMSAGASPPCSGDLAVQLQVTASAGQAESTKSKLGAAAQTWLAGQFGIGGSQPATSPEVPSAGVASEAPTIKPEGATAPGALVVSNTEIDPQLQKDLNGVPRRVIDEFKNQGDMVNFVIVGSQEQMQHAVTAANWHLADKSTEAGAANAILQTYQKKDYVQMPMSTLYLFNRGQDFGYEQAEAYAVAASRHHFRVWKAPFTWNGQPVWIGAGTHDIGFEKDQRNGKVTHKIDPAVDGERDHIGSTLQSAGVVNTMNYYSPSDPVKEAKNATGGSYHSDGRILVIFLR
jgi:hypothetical protein